MASQPNLNSNFPTPAQVPDKAILDAFNKQVYLGNAYVVPVTGFSLANTTETNLYLIQCPSTSTKSLFVDLRRYSSSAQQVVFKVYTNPTVSSTSTATTPVNQRPASNNTSAASCYLNGQFGVSAKGALASSLGCPSNYYITVDATTLFILDPGQSLLITATALTGGTSLEALLHWYEI